MNLKDSATIELLITGDEFSSVDEPRKRELAEHFEGMLPRHWQPTVTVLADTLPEVQIEFVAALFTDAPVVTPPPPPISSGNGFAPSILSVGDGAPTSLEALATVTLTPPVLRTVLIAASGELQDWALVSGDDANDALHQRPLDYNPASPLVWNRKR